MIFRDFTKLLHIILRIIIFFYLSDTLVNVPSDADSIAFSVRRQAQLTALAPTFTLTPGATIEPDNGSVHDFSNGAVIYTVTSEDQQWHRTYRVAFVPKAHTVTDTIRYDFNSYRLDTSGKYYTWDTSTEQGSDAYKWATGNPGFRLSKGSAAANEYPTVPDENGLDGAAVKLVTRDTGAFGQMVNMRIAAGNLFLGEFDVSNALRDALKATSFGVPFDRKPVKFIGHYRYAPGTTFQNKAGQAVEGRTDNASIYSVVYRNHDNNGNAIVLHGDDVLTNPLVVAIANVSDIKATNEWTRFEIDYRYINEIDEETLENNGYSLAVVFSSSENGANFEGAIGSTLEIDSVCVVCESEE